MSKLIDVRAGSKFDSVRNWVAERTVFAVMDMPHKSSALSRSIHIQAITTSSIKVWWSMQGVVILEHDRDEPRGGLDGRNKVEAGG